MVILITNDRLDWRYQFFFIEQMVTMILCLICKVLMFNRALNQSTSASNRMYRKYKALRSLVYAIEICLMIWV